MGLKINKTNIILMVLISIIGFFAGRWTLKPDIQIEYIQGETIYDTILKPVPYLVEVPAKPILPLKPDTIRIPGGTEYIVMKVDTAKIIANYIQKNIYKETLFDNDTIGKFSFEAVVQYNEMQKFGYDFTPIQKQTTIIKKRVLTPFLSTSYNSFGYFGAGGGIYYHDLGVGLKYMTDFQKTGYEIGFSYKF